ncbi:MAG: hypothetical protein R3349_10360, partial [Geminicoccaceae bacterium]|nr:hypothetical protein [Geminicoccaceae bacterium]
LEQWPMLWEKVARLFHRADALNLDRAHVLLLVLSELAGGAPEKAGPPASSQPGGLDAVG